MHQLKFVSDKNENNFFFCMTKSMLRKTLCHLNQNVSTIEELHRRACATYKETLKNCVSAYND